MDSTLEIAFKEYLVNESGQHYSDSKLLNLFKNRSDVEEEIKKYVKFPDKMWQKINYYYGIRCKIIHERATLAVPDDQIEDYGEVVRSALKEMFSVLV